MAKAKTVFTCGACGYETPRWVGRCPGCGAWNTLEESIVAAPEKAVVEQFFQVSPSLLLNCHLKAVAFGAVTEKCTTPPTVPEVF